MSEFNFKSSVCTSREQSERLLALGLKKETADCYLYIDSEGITSVGKPYCGIMEELENLPFSFDAKVVPAWSLHRLIKLIKSYKFELLGKELYGEHLKNFALNLIIRSDDSYKVAIEVIEAFIIKGYFNKEYLEK